ncbi:hypothetical protein OG217_22810 [Streptomyces sp. NBC_01023]|uniref:hypothetical protein n=1 Tax=unclassified Streptomyces TaxID=2593676 RepID=UPI0030E28161|nr:hypothetical protein OG217_22810 [Streptomyces sp. NBC_01023]
MKLQATDAAGRRGGYSSVHADTNHGTMIGQWFEAVRRHSGAALPPEWVARELADYSPIENEEEAALLLKANQVIVLVADNLGSGRWTAALRLLTTAPGELRTLRRVRRETGEAFSMEGLQGKKRTGWILDLRETEEGLPASCDFGLELHQVGDLRDDDSYLAVLVGTELWERIGHGAGELVLTPKPPDSGTLFTALLRSAGVTHPEAWAGDHRFQKLLPQLLPGQVWDWARILVQSDSEYRASTGRGTEPGTDGFEEVAKAAGNAVSGWMDVLATWHSRPGRTSYDRNYLLLAAVNDGAPIDNVHLQIDSLSQEFGEKDERSAPLAGQQGPGLIQLARQIEAVPRADGHLIFPGPGFAEAVVRYFWQDRPELTDPFTKWTAQLCLKLKHPQGTLLAQRMAPWILHHAQATRSTRLLRLVAKDWSENGNLAPHAHDLLVAAILDPEIGQRVRNATGTWAVGEDTPAPLLQTLARVFQSLTPAHPKQMLRRLGELANSQKDGVADAVGEAINALWSDDELGTQVHSTLNSWFDSDQETLQRTASSAFMHLALRRDLGGEPTLLAGPHGETPDWVVRGWRTALEAAEPGLLARRACIAWLDAAATQKSNTAPIITVLVRAVHETPTDHLRGQRFLNLVRLAEYWLLQGEALDAEARNVFRAELLRRTQLADPRQPSAQKDGEPSGD